MFAKTWFEILSELFVNLAAGWFAVVFIEPQFGSVGTVWFLIHRFILGMLSLSFAKLLRDESKKL